MGKISHFRGIRLATAFTGISPKSVSEHVRRPVRPSAGVRDGPVRDRAIPSHSVANAAASHRSPRRYLPNFTATTAPTISPVRTSRIQLSFTQSTRGDASSANPASDDANPSNPMRSLPISVPGTIRRRSMRRKRFRLRWMRLYGPPSIEVRGEPYDIPRAVRGVVWQSQGANPSRMGCPCGLYSA